MHIEYLYYFRDFSKSLSISKTAAGVLHDATGSEQGIAPA